VANFPTHIPALAIAQSSDTEPIPELDPAGVDPNHHLWRNGRLWWIAFTVHRGHLQERVRFSLKTDDVEVARERRDGLFALYDSAVQCRISLRFQPRRRGVEASCRRADQQRAEGCT
jgi:hypothetical protein